MDDGDHQLPPKDFSQSNPRLHRLYVTHAQDDIAVVRECIAMLSEVSRVNRGIMAGLLHKELVELIRSDAAYREALWRVETGDLLGEDPELSAKVAAS